MSYSVIIPTHNRASLLGRALRSVHERTSPAAEIIIVDDGSQPPLELPPELADPRVRVIRIETAGGGAAARNIGLARASTDIVAFLDDDDEWLPEKMRRQLEYLGSHPDCVVVSCGYTRVQNGRRYDEVFTERFVASYGMYDTYVGSFSFMAVRRAPGEPFRLLDPKLPAFQDWDYYLSLLHSGQVGVVEAPLVIYHAHIGSRITNTGRNRLRGLRRCYLRHRLYLPEDARRWILSRLLFERAQTSDTWMGKARLVIASARLGLPCKLPPHLKLRALAKRVLNIFVNVRSLESLRVHFLATKQWVSARAPSLPKRTRAPSSAEARRLAAKGAQ